MRIWNTIEEYEDCRRIEDVVGQIVVWEDIEWSKRVYLSLPCNQSMMKAKRDSRDNMAFLRRPT